MRRADGLLELAELACACLVVALIGFSFYVDLARGFDVSLPDTMLLVLGAFLAHEFVHKAFARGAGGGRFRMSITGSFYSLLVAGLMNAWWALRSGFMALSGIRPLRMRQVVPFRLFTVGTVVLEERRSKEVVGRVALSGPTTNLLLGCAMLLAGLAGLEPEVLVVGASLNAYMALGSLLPLAFCDGLPIYWCSRKAWAALLAASLLLIVMCSLAIYYVLPP